MKLLLVGGGHTNTQVIKHMHARDFEDVELTLVSMGPLGIYSGMLPAAVAGLYQHESEAMVDLRVLCRARGWTFVDGCVTKIDADARKVYTEQGDVLEYDWAAIDLGSVTAGADDPAIRAHAIATRPIGRLMPRIRECEDALAERGVQQVRVVVAGGGAAGVELAFALHSRLAKRFPSAPDVTIVERGAVVMSHECEAVQRLVAERLGVHKIKVVPNTTVASVQEGAVLLSNGDRLPHDMLIYSTGAAAPHVLADATASNMETDEKGFMCVSNTLQSTSHPNLFGAGDCVRMVQQPEHFPPKAGVYAVRMGPVLIHNILTCIQHARDSGFDASAGAPVPETLALREYEPQSGFLALLIEGDGRALGTKFGMAFEGPWVWELKNWIDRSWMTLFDEAHLTNPADAVDAFEPEDDKPQADQLSATDAAAAITAGTRSEVAKPGAEAEADAEAHQDTHDFAVQLAAIRAMAEDPAFQVEVRTAVSELQNHRFG